MAFFFIDQNDDYKLKADTVAMLFIPEIKTLVEKKGYGWNFVYYTFLFVSRSPFGRLPEEVRDQRIAEIIQIEPMARSSSTAVLGFYKHRLFKPVAEAILQSYPDPKYDAYLSSTNSFDKFRRLRDEIEVDPKKLKKKGEEDEMERNFALFEAYSGQMDALLKQMRSLEADMQDSLSKKTETMGMGAMKKQLERTDEFNHKQQIYAKLVRRENQISTGSRQRHLSYGGRTVSFGCRFIYGCGNTSVRYCF